MFIDLNTGVLTRTALPTLVHVHVQHDLVNKEMCQIRLVLKDIVSLVCVLSDNKVHV